jgi:DNA polymerase III alpha subunit (gram-positive type)
MTNNFPENQVFIVVDIEADGPNPGYNSMLSIGAVATNRDETIDKFYAEGYAAVLRNALNRGQQ